MSTTSDSTAQGAQSPMRPLGPTTRNSWQVSRIRVDLRRPDPVSAPITVSALPQQLTFDLARAAMVVIDMQNDFCHPDGWLAGLGVDINATAAPVAALQQLLPALRDQLVPVIWLNWGNRPDRRNLPPNVLHVYDPAGQDLGIGSTQVRSGAPVLQANSWGAAVVSELSIEHSDIQVDKFRMSGFFDTDLESVLRNLRIDTVLFAGVNADQCVMATLTDAACLGFDVVMIEEATATTSPAYCLAATLYNVRQCYGFTVRASDLLAALST